MTFIDHHKFSSYTPADMANTKSAIKRIRRISKQTAVNKARKSRFRNALKKMNILIDDKKKDEALKFLPKLNSELMKIAKTGPSGFDAQYRTRRRTWHQF